MLGKLIDAIDELVAADVQSLADGDSLVELHRQLARLEAVTTRASGGFDASGAWRESGARSAAQWMSIRTGVAPATMKGRVRQARELRHMPITEAAALVGDVSQSAVRLLVGARTPETADAFAQSESLLVGEAKRLRYGHLTRVIAYWKWRADASGAERDDDSKHESRRAHLSETFGGMWVGDQLFDPMSGTMVSNELKRLADELFQGDWAEAKARLGREPTVLDLRRTAAQRRADAWVRMAERSRAMPHRSRLPEPLITVLVGYETFAGPICQLAGGTVVAPGTVARLLDKAWIERIVFDGPSRVIDVGVRRRSFEGATRRVVEVRDRECFHPMCDMTLDDDMQVDHIEPFAAGGLTVQENGRLACPKHNRDRHKPRPPP